MDDKIVSTGYEPNVICRMAPMKDVLKIAVEVAIGLRNSLSKNGIRQMMDFVNGITFAGVQLQKNYRSKDPSLTFSETFLLEVDKYTEILQTHPYEPYRRAMMAHKIGITDQTPNEMLVTAGLSAQGTIETVSREYGLSRQDVLTLTTIILSLAIVSLVPEEELEATLLEIKQGISDKASTWDRMIPSDDEMLDGLYEDDEDE